MCGAATEFRLRRGEGRRRHPGSRGRQQPFYYQSTPHQPQELAPDLSAACSVAQEMRATVLAELQLPSSAGVARNKLAARLLSAAAKPAGELKGGLAAVADASAAAFLRSRRLLTIPGLQQKRGRALAEALSHLARQAGGGSPGFGPSSTSGLTLGDALSVGRAELARLVGEAEAAELLRLGEGGCDGGVVERGPARSISAEVTDHPTLPP